MLQTQEVAGRWLPGVVLATGEAPSFKAGDKVRVLDRWPVGHYRVPTYLRGKIAVIEAVIERPWMNNEEEGFERNAGALRHYYGLAVAMTHLCTTSSSVLCAPAILGRSWACRPTGTSSSPIGHAPYRSRELSSPNSEPRSRTTSRSG